MKLPVRSTRKRAILSTGFTHCLSEVLPELQVLPSERGACLLGHVRKSGVVGQLGVVVFVQRGLWECGSGVLS